MNPDVQPPVLERYGYTWIQHPDGLYYGPPYPSDEDILVLLELAGHIGHSSVRRGESRYVLRVLEDEDDRRDRFAWDEEDAIDFEDPEAEAR